jgi:hypothetical protein
MEWWLELAAPDFRLIPAWFIAQAPIKPSTSRNWAGHQVIAPDWSTIPLFLAC